MTALRGRTHLRQDVLVEMRLHRGHFHTKNALALGGQRRQHVALQPTQHQRLELLVQLLDLDFVVRIGEVKLVRQED